MEKNYLMEEKSKENNKAAGYETPKLKGLGITKYGSKRKRQIVRQVEKIESKKYFGNMEGKF